MQARSDKGRSVEMQARSHQAGTVEMQARSDKRGPLEIQVRSDKKRSFEMQARFDYTFPEKKMGIGLTSIWPAFFTNFVCDSDWGTKVFDMLRRRWLVNAPAR